MDVFDFDLMWTRASLLGKLDLLVLGFLSLLSWSTIFWKFWQYWQAGRNTAEALNALLAARSLGKALDGLGMKPWSPAHPVAEEGVRELKRLEDIAATPGEKARIILDSLRSVLDRQVQAQAAALFGQAAFLATCGAVAPLLGLFGTVWGIMHSFQSFAGMGSQSVASVAPGLAEALTTTALGLMVAIPAVLAYNALVRRSQVVEGHLAAFADVFLNHVKRDMARLLGPR
ncbi:MAG: MotA/TolQ/ExbB proton channel family protein [Thermodesulfobacteriota bacterium]